jgi:MoxR-like ATPase
MTWSETTKKTVQRLRRGAQEVRKGFVGRDVVVDLLELAVVSQEHVLLLGEPGTAKTEVIQRFAGICKTVPFTYLLTRFTEPAEIFGPIDIAAYQRGSYEIRTVGMLPEAELAFLDEVFQGSSAILNTLLSLVHERRFHAGSEVKHVPLLSLLAASNAMPDDANLRAFGDRFLLRCQVDAVPHERLGDLMKLGWELEQERLRGEVGADHAAVTTAELRALSAQLASVKLGPVRTALEELIRQARAGGIQLTDRRVVKCQKLVAAAALLELREEATIHDLWPLRHVWSDPAEATALGQLVDARLQAEGIEVAAATRAMAEIQDDLRELVVEEQRLRGDIAISAHLQALGRLRRELVADHGGPAAVLSEVDGACQRVLARLGD